MNDKQTIFDKAWLAVAGGIVGQNITFMALMGWNPIVAAVTATLFAIIVVDVLFLGFK